jgi:uncharacterized protein YlxW (UPF0749 family)
MAKEMSEKLLLRGELAQLEEKEPELRAEFKEKTNILANLTLSFVRLPAQECNLKEAKALIEEMSKLQEEIKSANRRIAELKKKLGV